jgi:hypothetical protein
MSTRNFDRMLDALDRPTFTVAGQEFTMRRRLSYKKLNMILFGEQITELEYAQRLFSTVLVPADRERFFALLDADNDDDEDDNDDKELIDFRQMQQLSKWVMDYYTGRDDPKDETSSNGQGTTGQPLNFKSFDPIAPQTSASSST